MSLWYKKFAIIAGMAGVLCASPAGWGASDPLISLSVQQTEMSDVLKFIAAQSGTSVVIAPDVSTRQLNLDLQDVPLSECLDVILKPYGYGYRRVGKTIVVDQLEGLKALTEVEPLQTKVFELNYLNANDITNLVKKTLSPRGSCSVVEIAQVAGWAFSEGGDTSEAAKRARDQIREKDRVKSSKTLVVQDVPESISRIAEVLAEIDTQSRQVEIRAYFVEFANGAVKDIGIDWGLSGDAGHLSTRRLNITEGLTGSSIYVDPVTLKPEAINGLPISVGSALPGASESSFSPALNSDAIGDLVGSGLNFGLLHSGSHFNLGAVLSAVQNDANVNVLSAPRILAQENQEAAILVGTRYPIVSFKEEDSGGVTRSTTKLEYYERIGIQLNVVAQICEDNLISMVVHPVVTEKDGEVAFKNDKLDVSYPIIKTREAETRLSVEDGQTIAIGGLISDRRADGVTKVPLLGDIPLLGRLFRRNTAEKNKIELVIFLNACVQGNAEKDIAALHAEVDRSEKALPLTWDEFYKNSKRVEPEVSPVSEEPEIVIPAAEVTEEQSMDAESKTSLVEVMDTESAGEPAAPVSKSDDTQTISVELSAE
ncbi:MAG: hypothetical protein MUC65_02070 [Pontiellaceae bacterium]|nr:hypothetical protein [Pontiellaceae bacterium]